MSTSHRVYDNARHEGSFGESRPADGASEGGSTEPGVLHIRVSSGHLVRDLTVILYGVLVSLLIDISQEHYHNVLCKNGEDAPWCNAHHGASRLEAQPMLGHRSGVSRDCATPRRLNF